MITKFHFEETQLEGLKLITPFSADDSRGCFIKDYSKDIFAQQGIPYDLQEVFYTVSYKGVVRALHFQREITQPKLVRCISGKIYDVIVDLRKDSLNFGKWQSFWLSGDNKNQLLIPGHCAHGYIVVEPSVVSYKCSEKFYGEYDDGILWNDETLGIEWPLEMVDEIILSDKDKRLQTFNEFSERYGGL